MAHESPQTLEQALAFVKDYLDPPGRRIELPVLGAVGYVLAEDVIAPVSLPRFDCAAMDGFAVRSADFGADGFALLRLTQTVAAGHPASRALSAGETTRITTGAGIPEGTERVIMQEYAQVIGDSVRLSAPIGGKPHIRRAGDDVQQGATVLASGTRIGHGAATLLIALGIRSVLVFARTKVALLSTGDELVSATGQISSEQIYDTNGPMLAMMLSQAGAEVTDLDIANDNAEEIVATLVAAAPDHDLLISSGGASAGFADHLAKAVSKRGYLEFWKLDMRPGKPIGFGDIDDCPILLLPGNPVAAAAGFATVGRAILSRLQGLLDDQRPLQLPLGVSYTKAEGRLQILMGNASASLPDGPTCVQPLPNQSSASIASLAKSEYLIVLPSDRTTFEEGDPVDIIPLWH